MATMKSHRHSSSGALSRRRFIQTTTLAAGAVAFGVPTLLRAANLNSKLNIAAIGVSGKGASDTDLCSGENIVALCDVDAERSATQRGKYPGAKFYQDFRKLFDDMAGGMDAVIVCHARPHARADRVAGDEAGQTRLLPEAADANHLRGALPARPGPASAVVTQMGNQGSAADGLRRAVECIQAGIIGPVREVHVWTQPPDLAARHRAARPGADADPRHAGLGYLDWRGPVRPFKKDVYHPFNWRGWQDFGTGALGDMACHTVNMPFRALKLGYPTEISATVIGPMNEETYPLGSRIQFKFPAADKTLFHRHTRLTWYDGGQAGCQRAARPRFQQQAAARTAA